MTSQRSITYWSALEMMTEGNPVMYEPVTIRPNTTVEYRVGGYGSPIVIVRLYDEPLADLFADGSIMFREPLMTNTTRNRLNDLLIPMGWKIKVVGKSQWRIVNTVQGGTYKNYSPSMILEPQIGSEVGRMIAAH